MSYRQWDRWQANSSSFTEGEQRRLYYVINSRGEFVLKELKESRKESCFGIELKAICSLDNHHPCIIQFDKIFFKTKDF